MNAFFDTSHQFFDLNLGTKLFVGRQHTTGLFLTHNNFSVTTYVKFLGQPETPLLLFWGLIVATVVCKGYFRALSDDYCNSDPFLYLFPLDF